MADYRRYRSQRLNEEDSLVQKLVEEFVTQLIICTVLIGIMYVAYKFNVGQVTKSLGAVKTAITHSTSWEELTDNTKEITQTIMDNMVRSEESSYE